MKWDQSNPWLPPQNACSYCGSTRFDEIPDPNSPIGVEYKELPVQLKTWYKRAIKNIKKEES